MGKWAEGRKNLGLTKLSDYYFRLRKSCCIIKDVLLVKGKKCFLLSMFLKKVYMILIKVKKAIKFQWLQDILLPQLEHNTINVCVYTELFYRDQFRDMQKLILPKFLSRKWCFPTLLPLSSPGVICSFFT